jgi:hypothetical protein
LKHMVATEVGCDGWPMRPLPKVHHGSQYTSFKEGNMINFI